MRRLAIMWAVVFAAALSAPVSAGNTALALPLTHSDFQDPVEQQSPDWHYGSNVYNLWRCTHDGTEQDMADGTGTEHPDNCVHNPYRAVGSMPRCTWDVDDQTDNQGSGVLAAGSSVSATTCNIADVGYISGGYAGDPLFLDAYVSAPKPGLTVTVSNTIGLNQVIAPVLGANGYEWRLCTRMYETGPYDPVPDSNGGYGHRVDWTMTVTAGSQSVRSIFAVFQSTGGIISLWDVGCPRV